LAHIRESLRMFSRAYKKPKRYKGDARHIAKHILDDCWNGTFMQVSAGHFCAFYCRDFGMITQSLLSLGHADKVKKTLSWALAQFTKAGRVTTTITKDGHAIDIFDYGVDSLPFLVRSLRQLNDTDLIKQYASFIEMQAIRYYYTVWDPALKVVRRKTQFSSIKDHYVRDSSCYDNCMVAMLHRELTTLGLDSPFSKVDFHSIIKKKFWTGTHFRDDLKNSYVSADANIFPFYCGVFDVNNDAEIFAAAVLAMRTEKLDVPFPIKYTAIQHGHQELYLPSILAPNYEGTAVWMHLGLCYLTVLCESPAHQELFLEYMEMYTNLIEKEKNFREVYTESGTPYRSMSYQSDESLSWVAIWLFLKLSHTNPNTL
ncbi:MAG TPA: hypothetical protein VK158_00745, partial [Acidobacteriota bacterium]|nr:hypothetical protein [Acidobacteriota bacterium]